MSEDISVSRRVTGEHQHHWNRVGTLKRNIVGCPDLHKNLLDRLDDLGKPTLPFFVPELIEQMLGAGSAGNPGGGREFASSSCTLPPLLHVGLMSET
jgi:hypothetical protein